MRSYFEWENITLPFTNRYHAPRVYYIMWPFLVKHRHIEGFFEQVVCGLERLLENVIEELAKVCEGTQESLWEP